MKRWIVAVAWAALAGPAFAQYQLDASTGDLTRAEGESWLFNPDNTPADQPIAVSTINGVTPAVAPLPGWAWTPYSFLAFSSTGTVTEIPAAAKVLGPANLPLCVSTSIYNNNSGGTTTISNDLEIAHLEHLATTVSQDIFINAGVTLTLSLGGCMFDGMNYWIKNGTGQGYLTSSYAGGPGTNELFLIANSGGTDYRIDDVIVRDYGVIPVRVVRDGNDSLVLGAANTYSGGTVINRGRLQAGAAAAYGTGPVQVRDNSAQAHLAVAGTFSNTFEIAGLGWNEGAGRLGAMRLENNARVAGTVTLVGNARIGTYLGPTAYLDNDVIGPFDLEKWGSGTLVLGTNTSLSGALRISQGTLTLAADGRVDNATNITLGAGAAFDAAAAGGYTQAAGRVFGGGGRVLGNAVLAGDLVVGASGVPGTLAFSNDLTLAATGTNYFELGASPTGANDTVYVGGTLTAGGSTIAIAPLVPMATNQPYRLFTSTATIPDAFGPVLVPLTRYVGTLDGTSVTGVDVVFSGGPVDLVWAGVSADWDANVTPNWNAGVETFVDLDRVVFDDTASGNFGVNVVGEIRPSQVRVAATSSYAFVGSGALAGAGPLVIEGPGALAVANSNALSGPVTVSNGVLVVAHAAALGTGGPAVTVEPAGILAVSNDVTFAARSVVLSGSGVRGEGGQNAIAGALTLAPSGTAAAVAGTLTLGGVLSGPGPLTVTGPAAVALSGANAAYTGEIVVAGGTLRAGNAQALGATSAPTRVLSGGTLDVSGQNLGFEPVRIAGAGAGGIGALINSGAEQQNAHRLVILDGDASVGGPNRFDIRGTGAADSAWLQGGTFTLTKVGANQFSLTQGVVAEVGEIVINNGTFAIETSTTINSNFGIRIGSAGRLLLWNLAAPLGRAVTADSGATLFSSAGAGAQNTITGEVKLDGAVTANLAGGNVTCAARVTGAGSLLKHGANTLTFTAANDFSGGLTITQGVVQVGTNGPTGDLGSGPVINDTLITILRANDTVLTNAITGAGSIRLLNTSVTEFASVRLGGAIELGSLAAGAATLAVGPGDVVAAGRFDVGQAAGCSGLVVQSGGVVNITGPDAAAAEGSLRLANFANETSTYTLNNGALYVTNPAGRISVGIDGLGVLNINGGMAWAAGVDVNGRNEIGGGVLNLAGGTLRIGARGVNYNGTNYAIRIGGAVLQAAAGWTSTGAVTLTGAGGAGVFDTDGNTNELAGVWSGPGGLVKAGPGLLVINGGPNAFAGGLTVSGGTVRVLGNGTLNRLAAGSSVFVAPGGTFEFTGRDALPINTGAVNFAVGPGGQLVFNGTAGFKAQIGALALSGGAVVGALTNNAGNSGETVLLRGNVTVTGSQPSTIDLQSGALGGLGLAGMRTFDVAEVTGDGAADLIVGGEVQSSTGGVVKTGAGRMDLTGSNSYLRATMISNGTLALGAAAKLASTPTIEVAGASAVFDVTALAGGFTVVSGQTVMGVGSVRGSLTASSSSTVAAGSSPGRLTISSNYTAQAGARLRVELAGTTPGTGYDQLAVQGAAHLGGLLLPTVIDPFVPPPGSAYTILTAAGGVTGKFSNAATNLSPILAGTNTLYVHYLPGSVVLSTSTSLVTDADGDGLTSDLDPNDGDPDTDDDGVGDLADFVAFGLDGVTNAAIGAFRVTSEARGSNTVIVAWPAIGSRFYSVESSTNLLLGEAGWQGVTNGISGPQGLFTNPAGRRFDLHRVKVQISP